jgi:4-hydroxybenzoate polyprenyltransferase
VSRLGRYLGASHPLPTIAVTAFVVALAVTLDLASSTVAVIGAATLSGQLSIGWSNDVIDADRDARSGRADKPLADGRIDTGLKVATAIALVLCIVLSLTVGLLAAACHLVGVACGWAYNLGMKSTVWSWLPYAIAFGLLPTWVFAAQEGAPWAPPWMMLAASTLGVSAHLVNAAPDIDDDRAEGITGLPQRWGAAPSVTAALGLLSIGAVVGLLGPAGEPAAIEQFLLAVILLIAVSAALAVTRAARAGRGLPRWTFGAMLALVAAVVALILSAAS